MPQIEVYMKSTCPFCIRAKRLLDMKGADYIEYEVSGDPERRDEMLERAPGASTVPQIFIDKKSIGGCDDLFALERSGRLDEMLSA